MRAGRLYRHPRCLDVDLQVARVLDSAPEHIEIIARYWHRSLKAFVPHAMATDTVKIKRVDLPMWREVTEEGEELRS